MHVMGSYVLVSKLQSQARVAHRFNQYFQGYHMDWSSLLSNSRRFYGFWVHNCILFHGTFKLSAPSNALNLSSLERKKAAHVAEFITLLQTGTYKRQWKKLWTLGVIYAIERDIGSDGIEIKSSLSKISNCLYYIFWSPLQKGCYDDASAGAAKTFLPDFQLE